MSDFISRAQTARAASKGGWNRVDTGILHDTFEREGTTVTTHWMTNGLQEKWPTVRRPGNRYAVPARLRGIELREALTKGTI